MARNIEIKVRIRDYNVFYQTAEPLCDSSTGIFQTDTYFNCRSGRLKLRVASGAAEIIHYDRTDSSSPKLSTYSRYPISDPQAIKELFQKALGIKGEIRKHRTVFLIGQTRVHLDKVDRLGVFAELEVVLHDGQTEAEGKQIAQSLMKTLVIESDSLISASYIDLMHTMKRPLLYSSRPSRPKSKVAGHPVPEEGREYAHT